MQFFKQVWVRVCSAVNFKLTHWTVWMGQGEGEDTKLTIRLNEDIWYWLVLEFLAWDCTTHICDVLHKVPLPKLLLDWKRNWGGDPEDADDPCTFEQYYGDKVGSLWCCFVEHPCAQWVWKHQNPYSIEWNLTLGEAREKFKWFPEKLAWVEKEVIDRKKRDEEEKDEK